MPWGDGPEGRRFDLASVDRDWASGVEVATRRRVHWAWHLPRQDYAPSLCLNFRIWIRDCRKERLGIWMLGRQIQCVARGNFNNPSQIHYCNLVAHLADNC